ncbi:MAG: hypothetical protein HYZ29_35945 [Myxococcales bacterium]|nr:hypothetical protein [Myxococcales bacterium]
MTARNPARPLPLIPELEPAPSVIVRDAETGSAFPPPPSTRRRARIRTLSGIGDGPDETLAPLAPIDETELAAVDELLAQSFAFDEL